MLEHPWELTPSQALDLQRELAKRVPPGPLSREVELIAGVDAGFEDRGATTRAAVVLCAWPALEVLEEVVQREPTRFPYIPGLLSFRELPAVLAALARLSRSPDLVLCDGQGIAHPRRLGIASHLAVLTDLATIGVAKSRLVGRHAPVGDDRGATAVLYDGSERIGTVLRSRSRVRPLYVSPGGGVSHDESIAWVLRCASRYRLPEPIRAADRLASRRGAQGISRSGPRSG